MNIECVGVVGLGTMGAGIVEVFAKAGFNVVGMDISDAGVTRGRNIITTSLERAVSKNKLSRTAADAILGRITWETSLSAAAQCQFIVEAAFEDLAVKQNIFRTLSAAAPAAIMATNTSSLSVTDIASVADDPSRVLGVHFFNPAPVQSLVEVIATKHTSEETMAQVRQVMGSLGKHPIYLSDRAGFVVNALLITYLNRAISLYEQGYASREDIDTAMVTAGYPMGPLTLADLIGNDVNLAIMERMFSDTNNGEHEPAQLLRSVVEQGLLGRKSGRGFYVYDDTAELALVAAAPQNRATELPLALLAPYFNDACRMVEVGYASEDDINIGMAEGCRMPQPFVHLREIGAPAVIEALEKIYVETGFAGHEPSAYLRSL
ncbi:MAG: 3-hydroxyacyl-CoA dehydrogenase NAD-binding domain-containing protein [Propionibacteriaceae bacterium]